MKALAINTCPLKENGSVASLLGPFLGGLRQAGAGVELYYSRDLLIFPCCGNLNCTVRTPGKCMAWDDMRWLRGKIGEADVLVLGSPLYYDGRTGSKGLTESARLFQERLTAEAEASASAPYQHAIHTTREAVSLRRVVLATGVGFWEIADFYPVLTHLKALCYNTFPELAGCLYGRHGVTVWGRLPEGASRAEIARIARSAGLQLGEECRQLETMPVACDVGESEKCRAPAVRWTHREWSSEILFEHVSIAISEHAAIEVKGSCQRQAGPPAPSSR
ncbi:MAG TPA: NAD(P)H-dependent oxidoreductase [Methanocella sp.]|nr:NAD(P)H-dependent oxidoreductase [Methanocella sp.]